jgi:hypothetical protein
MAPALVQSVQVLPVLSLLHSGSQLRHAADVVPFCSLSKHLHVN